MSHFTVMVRIASEKINAVAEMLAPFNEQTEDERYIEFVDEEDELRERYATGSTERIRCADGSLVLPWDKRFQVAGSLEQPEAPACMERVEVPFRETFPTFEAFAKDWCGHDGPKPNGRYGHTANPNGYWDWYEIGGRWAGFFPLSVAVTGHGNARVSDVAQIQWLDKTYIEEKRIQRREVFLLEYRELLAGKRYDAFHGPRDRAMRMGLLRVEEGPAVARAGEVILPWAGSVQMSDKRHSWNDVATEITAERLETKYGRCFNPLLTYAVVDNDGWHAPGKMGWFGCSDDEPEQYLAWCEGFVPRFLGGDQSDVLVLVDCHT